MYGDPPPVQCSAPQHVVQPSQPAVSQGSVATGCLKVMLFLVLLPVFLFLPPMWNALFTWLGSVLYFYRKDDDSD
jgi:hypothetical protein